MLVGGGTSIMPRIAPVLYDFVEADNGEYLEAAEAVLRIFDRQDWLRANRARARIKVFVDKFGIDELRRQADEERKGDWVDGARLRRRAAPLRRRRGGGRHEAADGRRLRAAERRPLRVRALGRAQRQAAAPGGLQHRRR